MDTLEILDRLVSFRTDGIGSNQELINFASHLLASAGAKIETFPTPDGQKASLLATIGPPGVGIILSGHTDVVGVEGQDWTFPPFELKRSGDRLYGRGTSDMKGFVAAGLAAMLRASKMKLKAPLHLALSYDEEIGCVGVRPMLDKLSKRGFAARACIVGEPTSMAVAIGHKGKASVRATSVGLAAHSSLAPRAVNAIFLAADAIIEIRRIQEHLAMASLRDVDYEIPYTTMHVGVINAGTALNIVPDRCTFEFEVRNISADDPEQLLADLVHRIDQRIADEYRQRLGIGTKLSVYNSYPALDTSPTSDVTALGLTATQSTRLMKVSYGTEGGLYASKLDVPTIVCGPGSIEQAHRADEYVAISQLTQCDSMLDAVITTLASGS